MEFHEINKDIKVANGDCLSILKKIDKNTVDLVLTDPPYNLGLFMKKRSTNMVQLRKNHFSATDWDHLSEIDWEKNINSFFQLIAQVTKEGGAVIIFMSLMKVETIIRLAEKHGFYYKTTGVWHKKNPIPRNMNLHFINSVEGWVYFTYKSKTSTFNNSNKALHDFIETGLTPASEKKHISHPTQKPEIIIKHFINVLTNKKDLVLDPFMGSGTTGKVCADLNRKFIGIEISENYYLNSIKRIKRIEK